MRLSKIRLAGFKSFVDPTNIELPSSLVGIVGPNGCGKSNVIDAVRWVMGESSAKHLRGDSMADVIFNGSASRKPVGTATIELCFDNSDGSIGGQYAEYGEISIKRSIGRDGTSLYFLNNTRCRRKDITDIFLGTGLGARSYAIIEQGMVSRLVEARPEDMRTYLEEAAGISRYKERRRETETRIQHTRDNLSRVNDLRDEVAKQIDYLQRQAKTAERYKEHKSRERRLEAELYAIRLAELDRGLETQRLDLARGETALEAALAEQRLVETRIVEFRERHIEATDGFNTTQARFYAVQSEVSRLEQGIGHARELRERQRVELAAASEQLAGVVAEAAADQARLQDIEAALATFTPDLDAGRAGQTAAEAELAAAEEALDRWQDAWHQLDLELKELRQHGHVEETRIEHLEAQLATLRRQRDVLEREHGELLLPDLEQRLTAQVEFEQGSGERVRQLTTQLAQFDRQIESFRARERALSVELETVTGELASSRGQLTTLDAVQRAALGAEDASLGNWLTRRGLSVRPRLAQQLRAEARWMTAVETVLGEFLQAVCVVDPAAQLEDLPDSPVYLVDDSGPDAAATDDAGNTLAAKVARAGRATGLLQQVRTAESLPEALQLLPQLKATQSVITPDGIWLGQGWVRIARGKKKAAGLLSRQNELRTLQKNVAELEGRVGGLETDRNALRGEIEQVERDRTQAMTDFHAVNREHAEAVAVLDSLRQDLARTRDRRGVLERSTTNVAQEMATLDAAIAEAAGRRDEAAASADHHDSRRPDLQRQQGELLLRYNSARAHADAAREAVARLNVEYEGRRVSRDTLAATLERLVAQREQLNARAMGLEQEITSGEQPLLEMQRALSTHLDEQLRVERELAGTREALEGVESELRAAETQRAAAEKAVTAVRQSTEALRLQVREVEIRREGLMEHFVATGAELAAVLAALSPETTAQKWQEDLDEVRRKIDRLGPINLAAIEQFTEQSDRKKYLDAQCDDLNSALATLEQAIRKIDRETRSRFQETFDNINQGLKRIFPRLFGGGHAYLAMEGDDVLAAGVTVMARPPGKRNSHIHLLSGGEKALTAVALIFAIFELNPAPFCLLDEVDAPLDEANVGRFCEIVREMSQRVQFLVITHNKTTMEMVNQLTGVTMQEPGVSRLVSVDLDEAVQLATG